MRRHSSRKSTQGLPDSVNEAESTNNKIFVGGIPFNVQERELFKYFSKFGEVAELTLPFSKRKKRLKGFAFVGFSTRQGYQKALIQKHHFLKGRVMTARPALGKSLAKINREQVQRQKIFAKGFPARTTEVDIFNFFSQYGLVNRILIGLDQNPRLDRPKFRGFAYIVMDSRDDFEAIIKMKELSFNGSVIRVSRSRTQEEILLESESFIPPPNMEGTGEGTWGRNEPQGGGYFDTRGQKSYERYEDSGSELSYGSEPSNYNYDFEQKNYSKFEGNQFYEEMVEPASAGWQEDWPIPSHRDFSRQNEVKIAKAQSSINQPMNEQFLERQRILGYEPPRQRIETVKNQRKRSQHHQQGNIGDGYYDLTYSEFEPKQQKKQFKAEKMRPNNQIKSNNQRGNTSNIDQKLNKDPQRDQWRGSYQPYQHNDNHNQPTTPRQESNHIIRSQNKPHYEQRQDRRATLYPTVDFFHAHQSKPTNIKYYQNNFSWNETQRLLRKEYERQYSSEPGWDAQSDVDGEEAEDWVEEDCYDAFLLKQEPSYAQSEAFRRSIVNENKELNSMNKFFRQKEFLQRKASKMRGKVILTGEQIEIELFLKVTLVMTSKIW